MSTAKKTILIIDDEPTQVKLLHTKLADHGYEVYSSTEASEGLQLAFDKRPDLIILDVMMPIINGYNICRLLKTEARDMRVSVIMLTSRDEQEDLEIGQQAGADAYLTKPVNMELFLSTVSRILQ